MRFRMFPFTLQKIQSPPQVRNFNGFWGENASLDACRGVQRSCRAVFPPFAAPLAAPPAALVAARASLAARTAPLVSWLSTFPTAPPVGAVCSAVCMQRHLRRRLERHHQRHYQRRLKRRLERFSPRCLQLHYETHAAGPSLFALAVWVFGSVTQADTAPG